jgi:hypothetical protein
MKELVDDVEKELTSSCKKNEKFVGIHIMYTDDVSDKFIVEKVKTTIRLWF